MKKRPQVRKTYSLDRKTIKKISRISRFYNMNHSETIRLMVELAYNYYEKINAWNKDEPTQENKMTEEEKQRLIDLARTRWI